MKTVDNIKLTTTYMLPKYENADGYCIFLYRNVKDGTTVTCKGNYLPKTPNIKYEMSGVWEQSVKHGRSLSVYSYREIIENNKESMVAYLSSGVIKGIGKVTAERIYLRFGNSSLEVIEKNPEKLLSIKGISPRKLEQIKASYEEKVVSRAAIEFLLPFGITAKQTMKVIKSLNIQSVLDIKKQPYRIFNIHGITIHAVDAIARKLGIPEDDEERIAAHANHVLIQGELSGHTGIEANEFGLSLIRSLNSKIFTKANICEYTIRLIKEGRVRYAKIEKDGKKRTFIYRSYTYEKEQNIAKKIYALSQFKPPVHKNVRQEINRQCAEENLQLDETQMQAVEQIIENSFLVITGGPGTGKTTIIKQAANYLKTHEKNRRMVFMAPSGRAARRIKEATGYDGFTINSVFNLLPGESWDLFDEDSCIEDTTFFCDEASMVGVFLMSAVLDRIRPSCRFIFVGDEDQLPSVEAGSVLRDIIASAAVPVIRLTHFHRQNEKSLICLNSRKIKAGMSDLEQGEDFHIIQCAGSEDAQNKMVTAYMRYVKEYGIENIYCIVPRKDGYAGVKQMNSILQEKINPLKEGMQEFKAHGMKYRVNDPVMHLKNGKDIANGDTGFVSRIYVDESDGIVLEVTYFGDTVIKYTMDNIDELTMAYAFTVHKSQGSENKVVLTYLSRECGIKMLKRNLPYTALSRGKVIDELYLTKDDALKIAIENDDKELRNTSLKYHLQRVFSKWVCVQ